MPLRRMRSRSVERNACSRSGAAASATAASTYAAGLSAISDGSPRRASRLAPTREACARPASVTTGTPIHSASQVVVVPP